MTRPGICRHTSAADDIQMMGESGQRLLKPESSTPARLSPREIQGLRTCLHTAGLPPSTSGSHQVPGGNPLTY